jgi:ribonuclease HI
MNDLYDAANRAERAASRRLAGRTGMSGQQALRQTLEQSAGDAGLAALLAQRAALRAAEAARAAARQARKQAAQALRQARHDGAPTAWRAWFDGSAHPNPGRCAIGALLRGPAGEQVEISLPAGYGNSSEAEYRALVALLEAAVGSGAHGLTIYGDSQVVVDDVNGPEHAGAPSLRHYRLAAHALLAQLRDVALRWIPRHRNTEADALSQRAAALHPGEQTDASGS